MLYIVYNISNILNTYLRVKLIIKLYNSRFIDN